MLRRACELSSKIEASLSDATYHKEETSDIEGYLFYKRLSEVVKATTIILNTVYREFQDDLRKVPRKRIRSKGNKDSSSLH